MPREFEFIQAIRENPDDRLPLMVYADWLDEQGDTRGELIRLQLAFDQSSLGDPQREIYRRGIGQLTTQHGAEWLVPLKRRGIGLKDVRFRFGLIESVKFSPQIWDREVERGMLDEVPQLVGVVFPCCPSNLPEIFRPTLANQILSLEISIRGQENNVQVATSSRKMIDGDFPYLHDLRVHGGGRDSLSGLFSVPRFPNLKRLTLMGNGLSFEDFQQFVDADWFPQLERLTLGARNLPLEQNAIGDLGVRTLVSRAEQLNLRWLDLSDNNLGDSSAWDLANANCLNRLEFLRVSGNRFRAASRTALEAKYPGSVFTHHGEPRNPSGFDFYEG